MSKNKKISLRQKQIIVGKILGDGCLETVNDKTYRLKIEHSYKQREYVDWVYKELIDLASNIPKIKIQKVKNIEYKKYWFNTRYSSSLRFYGHQFYVNGKKTVPKLIHRWLTPLSLAIWFMDDGSIKSRECKAKIFNTQGFDKESLKKLQEAIKRNFNIITTLRKQKEGYQIYIPADETKKLRNIIDKYIIPSMKYKLD